MNSVPGLFDSEMDFIGSQTWYRQRFDACPHFMFFVGRAHHSGLQKTKYPFAQRIAFAGFSKNRADWYHSLEELQKTASKIIGVSKQKPGISEEMIQAFKPFENQFYAECLRLNRMNLSDLTDEALLKTYNHLEAVYLQKLNGSGLIDGFALSTDTVIASQIQAFLEANFSERKFVSTFEVLTAPSSLSFLQLEELALLKAAREIQKNPAFRGEIIRRHAENYFWIQNNYVADHVLGVSFFEKRFEDALVSGSLNERIQKIESFPLESKKKKENVMNDLCLPPELRILLKITDDFTYWQDERKKGTFWATHYFSLLLSEFARRTSYSLDELKYCMPPEMGLVLKEKISKEELQRRFEYCMVLWTTKGYEVITDIKRIVELDRIGTGKLSKPGELRGFTACLGTATGTVRIVESAEELNKVQDGDILVAVMTRPDYLPAMKRAAAFITDEGGITCHAAIVARELQKPCIIGTKVATKTLKDGDVVSVRANHGVVQLLRKSEQ